MPKQLELYPEDEPYSLSNSAIVRASTTARGDVEIARDNGDSAPRSNRDPERQARGTRGFLIDAQ
jgi:hypothetical protein